MRLQVEILPENAVRLSSPDIPGMVRQARGMDQLWREFRAFIGAHHGVQAGTWQGDEKATLDQLLGDAEGSTSSATRAAARRLRASWDRLQRAIEDSRAEDAAAQRRARQLAEAEAEVAKAQEQLAAAREKVRSLKPRKKKGSALPAANGGKSARSAAALGKRIASPDEVAQRRARVKTWLDSGVTSPAAIAARIGDGIDTKTVSNDIRALKGA